MLGILLKLVWNDKVANDKLYEKKNRKMEWNNKEDFIG